MKNFKQRPNERPYINPTGFAGIIVKNSNAVIDKTFIAKGTSFVNAYDNANVVLKDCATPVPDSASPSKIRDTINKKLQIETETIELPPWMYYKIARSNAFLKPCPPAFYIGKTYAAVDKRVAAFREEIAASSGSLTSDKSIEARIVAECTNVDEPISSKDISYTMSGTYFLSGMYSAIKAVWPLDIDHLVSMDTPKLNLHFKKRLFFPILNANRQEIEMSDVTKKDAAGNDIYKKGSENADEPIRSTKTQKMKFKSERNTPSVTGEKVDLTAGISLFKHSGEYYIDEPYQPMNAVYNQNSPTEGQIEVNDDKPLDLYFKLTESGEAKSLRAALNKTLDIESLDILEGQFGLHDRIYGNASNTKLRVDPITSMFESDNNYFVRSVGLATTADPANDYTVGSMVLRDIDAVTTIASRISDPSNLFYKASTGNIFRKPDAMSAIFDLDEDIDVKQTTTYALSATNPAGDAAELSGNFTLRYHKLKEDNLSAVVSPTTEIIKEVSGSIISISGNVKGDTTTVTIYGDDQSALYQAKKKYANGSNTFVIGTGKVNGITLQNEHLNYVSDDDGGHFDYTSNINIADDDLNFGFDTLIVDNNDVDIIHATSGYNIKDVNLFNYWKVKDDGELVRIQHWSR